MAGSVAIIPMKNVNSNTFQAFDLHWIFQDFEFERRRRNRTKTLSRKFEFKSNLLDTYEEKNINWPFRGSYNIKCDFKARTFYIWMNEISMEWIIITIVLISFRGISPNYTYILILSFFLSLFVTYATICVRFKIYLTLLNSNA